MDVLHRAPVRFVFYMSKANDKSTGLAVKHGIDVGAGVIDADYRGSVGVLLFNFDVADFKV